MGGRYTPPKRTVVLSADIPDDAPQAIREGLARRRLVATTGECPCGARLHVPDRLEAGAVHLVSVQHEPDCPAGDENLDAELEATGWRWRR